MKSIAMIVAAVVFVTFCAVFRINLWTLTPWSTKIPSKLDDEIITIRNDKQS